jgi:hypothetical protein
VVNLLFVIVIIYGFVRVCNEYKYILDYKRDERTFFEYGKSKKEDLESIVDDPGSAPF